MEKEDLVGASVVIGLRIVDQKGGERFEAYFGQIRGFRPKDGRFEDNEDGSDVETMIVACHDGEEREYPFDPDVFEVADPGLYELPGGATIEDPDYEIHWRITEPARH